jgi:type IV pilus assembly protein PilM
MFGQRGSVKQGIANGECLGCLRGGHREGWHPTCLSPPCMALPFFDHQPKRLDQVVAVDLGGRQTKAVHLQSKGDRMVLLGYTLQEAPRSEKKLSVETLGAHVRGVFKALGDRTRHAALAVGVLEAAVRHAELPPLPLADMRQMLRLNSKTYLQQDYPDHVFDCAPLLSRSPAKPEAGKAAPSGPLKQKVLVGATKRQMLDDLKAACRAAGVQPQHIGPGMVGPINAFEAAEPELFAKEVLALVEIGFKHSVITMLRQGELVMNRVVAIGGDHLTNSLAEALGISPAEAEGIKIGMPTEVQAHLEPAVVALGRELRASLDFFEHQQDVAVSQVFLSGGSARSEFIVRALQNELMVPCKTWNPAGKLHLSLPAEQQAGFEAAAPQLAVAVGTALAAF